MTLEEFWPQCLGRLKSQLKPQQYQKWIAPLTVGEENGTWVIFSTSHFANQLISRQYGNIIREIQQSLAPQAQISFKVGQGQSFHAAIELEENNDTDLPIKSSSNIKESNTKNTASSDQESSLPKQPKSPSEEKEFSTPEDEPIIANKNSKNPLETIKRLRNEAAQNNKSAQQSKHTSKNTDNKHEKTKKQSSKQANNLLPEYTFENLVEGKGNRIALQAALAIAEKPARTYNPFFVYGSTGLGKTHLVQAIGHQMIKNNPETKVCYIHANEYVDSLMRTFRNKDFDRFRAYYNAFDLLIIDDIQFIKDKDRTMEEFFYLYNHYHDSNRQIILTCDVMPKDITGMDDRLKSRFSWGLTLEIEPPELEMRAAIVQQWAKLENITIDDLCAIQIAKLCRTNVRELMGAFNKVKARSTFSNQKIDEDLINDALKDLVAEANKVITAELVIQETSKYYHIKNSDILGKKRTRNIARPRQVAMALTKELTSLSLPSIGEAFGGRDHTTVIHAVKNISKLREQDPELAQDYEKLIVIIKN